MAETTGMTTPIGALPARTDSRTILTTEDPDIIRGEIERTRAEMGRTIDRIQERLTPEYFKEQAVDALRETTKQKVNSMTYQAQESMRNMPTGLIENVRANPMPYALIGLGLGWLVMSRRDSNGSGRADYSYRQMDSGYGYGYSSRPVPRSSYAQTQEPGITDRMSDTMAGARQSAEGAVENVEGRVRDVASAAQRKAEDVTSTVREGVQDARTNVSTMTSEASDRLQEEARMARENVSWQAARVRTSVSSMMEQNPLVIGAAALVAGTIIGLMLPSTSMENELLGEKRDQLMAEARTTAGDVMQRAQRVAEEARYAAMSAAEEEARRQELPIPSSTSGSDQM